MREIKFRGLTQNNEFRYGLLTILKVDIDSMRKKGAYLSNKLGMPFAFFIKEETIGQYTGMKDCNGNEIYEGDIVKGPYGEEKMRVVEWEDGDNAYSFLEYYEFPENFEIIGNIYTTPELMKNV